MTKKWKEHWIKWKEKKYIYITDEYSGKRILLTKTEFEKVRERWIKWHDWYEKEVKGGRTV